MAHATVPATSGDGGLLMLPRVSSAYVLALCIALYVSLAILATSRLLALSRAVAAASATLPHIEDTTVVPTPREATAHMPETPTTPPMAPSITPGGQHRRAHHVKRQQTFQRFLIGFALTRTVSLLVETTRLRDLLNRLALCLFFSLVFVQVLFWIDIANPKRSARSRRIWNAFLFANAFLYAIVLVPCVLHSHIVPLEYPMAPLSADVLDKTDIAAVVMVGLGSLMSAIGLIYSTSKTRRRVGRVLQQADQAHQSRQRLRTRVAISLQRALRRTNVIMSLCVVALLYRTVLYLQRPFSRRICGFTDDTDTCIVIGYALPEALPSSLFLILMWKVEPRLELPSRRRPAREAMAAVVRATETTPLLLHHEDTDCDPMQITINTSYFTPQEEAVTEGTASSAPARTVSWTRSMGLQSFLPESSSALSPAAAGSVIAMARRRFQQVFQNQLGVIPVAPGGEEAVDYEADSTEPNEPPSLMWMSFCCVNLTLPSGSIEISTSANGVGSRESSAVFIVVERMEVTKEDADVILTEIGRTEIVYNSMDPYFQVMVPVAMVGSLRVSVYAVHNFKNVEELQSQGLIGVVMVPLSAFHVNGSLIISEGAACIRPIASSLSGVQSCGELVMRCEALIRNTAGSAEQIKNQRRTSRGFVYSPLQGKFQECPKDCRCRADIYGSLKTVAADSVGVDSVRLAPLLSPRMLVEEDLVESVYTWKVPLQLLKLILSDLHLQLTALEEADTEVEAMSVTTRGRTESNFSSKQERSQKQATAPVSPTSPPPLKRRSSIGMLSEMILHIQDDALSRKSQQWRTELTQKMENYICDVEAAIVRYEDSTYEGLTFKPSTRKADSALGFLALNLHQQLIAITEAVPASGQDVVNCFDELQRGRYVELVNLPKVAMIPSATNTTHASEHHDRATHAPFPSIVSPNTDSGSDIGSSSFYNIGTVAVISEDQDSNIPKSIPTETELDCAFADPASAVFHPDALSSDSHGRGESEAEEEPEIASSRPTNKVCMHALHPEMHGITTVGAFAAHVYGFRKGGIRQLRSQLEHVNEQLRKENERPSSDLTVEALERESFQLKWHIDRRLEVALCQSLSALVTCFQQTLYVHLHGYRGRLEDIPAGISKQQAVFGLAYLEQLASVGFLFSVESLVSTYSNEAGMLGDMDAAVRELEFVRIKLLAVESREGASFCVSVVSSPQGLVVELPVIVSSKEAVLRYKDSMHCIPGQDATTGAVHLLLGSPADWSRIRHVFECPISIVPVIFSQGINEMQTVANTVGKDALQKEINAENLVVLEKYVSAYVAWRQSLSSGADEEDGCKTTSSSSGLGASSPQHEAQEERQFNPVVTEILRQLRESVQRVGRGKHMDILTLSSSIARAVGGGRVTCCKSAKDRTAMSVTLEEATLLVEAHRLHPDERDVFTSLLRSHGVRRENARKNIGQAQYCFSALQNFMLPADYQCPPGTGGGSRVLS